MKILQIIFRLNFWIGNIQVRMLIFFLNLALNDDFQVGNKDKEKIGIQPNYNLRDFSEFEAMS